MTQDFIIASQHHSRFAYQIHTVWISGNLSSGKSRHLLDKSCEGSPGPCCHEESESQEGGINHLFEERPKISVSGKGHPA
ncbi:hypothetical protein Celaphus_00018087 [Cervus elaphus hippelaphus]|uniref:Uncharacterized protein n=1 Tax=Cervus elaphus hippelaphus TaxID=46360 RepID=A0A212C8A7_CEREH|nr:hypothetical protein Celaphus_00018087 [Cervus elaphus hippelaphus]